MSLDVYDKKDNSPMIRLFGFGFLVWLIPFLVSFLFYTPQGSPMLSAGFFNSIMSVILGIVTAILLLKYFKHITVNYMAEAIKVGIAWLVMSIVLDLVILLPMAKMEIGKYLTEVGLGYVLIFVIAVFAGYLLEEKGAHSKKIYSQIFSTKK
jgi:hypothetical protein